MKNYLKFPLPTTASWFRLPERVKALEDSSFNAADYDLADFTNTGIDPFVKTSDLPPYKVYTALLTQSGGDSLQQLYSGAVTKGVTYRIKETTTGDFSNVGAPNNNVNTIFVATNDEVPNNYSGGGLAYNTGAPVVTVLENTIGNIWFTYNDVGYYSARSIELFKEAKTLIIASPNGFIESTEDIYNIDISFGNSKSQLDIVCYYNNTLQDDVLNYSGNAMIEIRVYN